MTVKTRRRYGRIAYFLLGTAVGVYLVYLLIDEFGSAASRDTIIRAMPVSLLVLAWFPVPLVAATQSWRRLFPAREEPGMLPAARLTWIGLGVNWLLPVAMVGGELIKFRLWMRHTARTDYLVASLVGDKTIQVATQLVYTLAGLSILALASDTISAGVPEVAGFLLFCAAVYWFYRLQRAGMFSRVVKRMKSLVGEGESVQITAGRIDAAVDDMYRRGGRWWQAAAWRMLFRLMLAGEVALVLWWLGEPPAIGAVLALESIAQASRVAALVVPAALGAQEAAILAAGLLLGIPPEALFAVATVKRIRELVVGGAGLIAWQFLEARTFIGREP